MYAMIHSTLCPKQNDQEHFDIQCIKEECDQCGLDLLNFHTAELDSRSTEKITWFKFDYVNREYKGRMTRHLELVKMQTAPHELANHLRKHLKGFPLHLFTAKWQRIKWNNLVHNLPADHAAIEMDFSDNYTTIIQEEAQSLHWGKTQCTIHSCVIWRPMTENEHQAANSDIPPLLQIPQPHHHNVN